MHCLWSNHYLTSRLHRLRRFLKSEYTSTSWNVWWITMPWRHRRHYWRSKGNGQWFVRRSDDWVMAMIKDLIGAGLQTTFSTLTWLLLYATTHDDIQANLHSEIDSVLVSRASTSEDRRKMPYMEATLLSITLFFDCATCLSSYDPERHQVARLQC